MPFELTHIAVAQQVCGLIKRPLTQQMMAGVLYPDVRYPFLIDRTLTHTMNGLPDPAIDDFAYGVWLHLNTDLVWDYFVLMHGDVHLSEVKDKALFIGLLKIVHDKLCYTKIIRPEVMATTIAQSTIPSGLPVTLQQWDEWKTALARYLREGATDEGISHMVKAMKYVDPTILESQRVKIAQLELQYAGSLEVGFEAVVRKLSLV